MKRLLIVDDVSLCRKYHRRSAGVYFQDFIEAANGLEAVEAVRTSITENKPIDCIFMDNSMPAMNGTTATMLIRKLGFNGKIYGITGNALKRDIDDFIAHGVDDVHLKPLAPQSYEKMLKQM